MFNTINFYCMLTNVNTLVVQNLLIEMRKVRVLFLCSIGKPLASTYRKKAYKFSFLLTVKIKSVTLPLRSLLRFPVIQSN